MICYISSRNYSPHDHILWYGLIEQIDNILTWFLVSEITMVHILYWRNLITLLVVWLKTKSRAKMKMCTKIIIISLSLMNMGTNQKEGMPRYLSNGTDFTSECAYGWQPQSSTEAAVAVGQRKDWPVVCGVFCIFLRLLRFSTSCAMNSLSWLETPRLTRFFHDALSWMRTSQYSGSMWHFFKCHLECILVAFPGSASGSVSGAKFPKRPGRR